MLRFGYKMLWPYYTAQAGPERSLMLDEAQPMPTQPLDDSDMYVTLRPKSHDARKAAARKEGVKVLDSVGGCFIFGILLMFIPVIGWVIGPLMIAMGAFQLVGGFLGFVASPLAGAGSTEMELVGNCPYCGIRNVTSTRVLITQCKACKNDFVYRDDAYHRIR